MELFETYFEDNYSLASEYTFGDLSAKWRKIWSDAFLPAYKDTMSNLQADVNKSNDKKILNKCIDQLEDIVEECQDTINDNGFSVKNFFRCFGMVSFTGPLFVAFATINDVIKINRREGDGYNFYLECKKVAQKTLPKAKELLKKAKDKIKKLS